MSSDQTTPASDDPTGTDPSGPDMKDIASWADLGAEMWSYLTSRGAEIDYRFVDMTVEVPRDTGPDAPRATWKLDGTLRVTTRDDQTRPPQSS